MICPARPASMPRRRSAAAPATGRPIANFRNDRGSSQQGQGNTVSQSLPEAPRVRLHAASDALRDATLARADAAVLMLPVAEARSAIAKLPQAALWQRLYQADRRAVPAPVLVARLPNRRGTLVVV